MCTAFESRSLDAFLGLVRDNVGSTNELSTLWRLFDQALSIIHSFGDATGQIALQGGLSCARFLPVLTHHAGMKISQLDCEEGRFYREALAHLRSVHLLGYRSALEEKRMNDMDRIIRTWNSIFGDARRILRLYGWRDPLAPCLQILPGSQTSRRTQHTVRSLRLVH